MLAVRRALTASTLRNLDGAIVSNTCLVTLLASEDVVAVANASEDFVDMAVANTEHALQTCQQPLLQLAAVAIHSPPAAACPVAFASGKAMKCKRYTSSEHALPTCPQLHLRK